MASKKTDYEKLVLHVAEAICKAENEWEWKYLKDIEGNPSTAYQFHTYVEMADAAIKEVHKDLLKFMDTIVKKANKRG